MTADEVVRLVDAAPGVPLVVVGPGTCDHGALRAAVADSRAGAVVTFEGVTREVESLDYEAHAPMAAAQIVEVAAQAVERHDVCAIAVAHEVGAVRLGDPSVMIVVSTPHRGSAFEAGREVIDELKRRAPIWKTEVDRGERTRVEGTVPPVGT